MYFCETCNYKTEYSSNFCIHKKSKKHINTIMYKSKVETNKNEKDINNDTKIVSSMCSNNIKNDTSKSIVNYNCENCGNEFSYKNNYYRHRKTCMLKNFSNKIIEKEKEMLKKEKELMEKEFTMKLEMAEKEKDLYKSLEKEKTELLNNFMNSANKIINKEQDNNKVTTDALKTVSISAIKYANEKFKNAPALLPIQNFNINNLDFNNEEDKKQLVEILIYNAKQKSLDKLLGDHIVKQYKKEKPEDQMFHTTDCSRLNYIVRQLMENALIWSVDKSGIEICSSIIKPLIKKCIDTLLEHQKYLLTEMGKGDLSKQTDVELIISILMSIDSGLLETEINKYIAPYFNLDKKINFI